VEPGSFLLGSIDFGNITRVSAFLFILSFVQKCMKSCSGDCVF